MVNITTDDLPPPMGERHVLEPHEELRLEMPFVSAAAAAASSGSDKGPGLSFCLQKGSCELWGCELALNKVYHLPTGGVQIALFTWHGCVVDVHGTLDSAYTSSETEANVSVVNTHAQLEALRDEAVAGGSLGPRVLICGPGESGKTTLCKTLLAYATKLGRAPLWVDLNPASSDGVVPGTIAVAPMSAAVVTVESYAMGGMMTVPPPPIPGTANANNNVMPSTPLALWHGSGSTIHTDLFKAQVEALAQKIDARLDGDEWARSSGIIVDTNGLIQDDGFDMLTHAIDTLKIDIVLIMGHDRLYSMMNSHFKKRDPPVDKKILKMPRSGGVVSRSANFARQARSRSIKRYFYGDLIDAPPSTNTGPAGGVAPTPASAPGAPSTPVTGPGVVATVTAIAPVGKVSQLTPVIIQHDFSELTVYKASSISLSSSLLPVAQQQTTDAVQVVKMFIDATSAPSLQHRVVAVCHPASVAAYEESGRARDLVQAGIAGVCVIDTVDVDTDRIHLLSPCAGALPSRTLLIGDVTWME